MARAEILIEDADGVEGANVRFNYPDAFDPTSKAHQLTNIIRLQLDHMVQFGALVPIGEQQSQGDLSAQQEQLAVMKTEGVSLAALPVEEEPEQPLVQVLPSL